MSEKRPATKFRVWSIFSFIFAGFDGLAAIYFLIAWVQAGKMLFSGWGGYGAYALREMSGIDLETTLNIVMFVLVAVNILHVLIDVDCGIILRRPVRKSKAPYIVFAIRDIILAIIYIAMASFVFAFSEGYTVLVMIGVAIMIPGAACIISVVMLFMRGLQDETVEGNDSSVLQAAVPPVIPVPAPPVMDGGAVQRKTVAPQPSPSAPVQETAAAAIPPAPQPSVSAPSAAKEPMGRVKCIEGVAQGKGFKLPENREIIVGKSPQKAGLVIDNPHISNVHCSIRYVAATDSYIVKDQSSNGTFVNGVRLQNGVGMQYPAGTVLSLAEGTDKITLG